MSSFWYSGQPIVILHAVWADALGPELCGLRILKAQHDPSGRMGFGAEIVLPPPDVLAAFVEDVSQKAEIEQFYSTLGLPPPPIYTGCTPLNVVMQLAAALRAEVADAALREVELRRALFAMRSEAEETRTALRRFQTTATFRLYPEEIVAARSDEAAAPAEDLIFEGPFGIACRTRTDIYGLTAVAFHATKLNHRPDDCLVVSLYAEERGDLLGQWRIPADALPSRRDWVVLDLPFSLAVARQTASIRFAGQLAPTSKLALASARRADPEERPEPALRLFTSAGPRYAETRYWEWTPEYNDPAPTPLISIPAHCWLGARLLGAGADVGAHLVDRRIKIPSGAGVMLVFPDVPLEGFAAVTVRLRASHDDAISAALSLAPPESPASGDHAAAEAAALTWSPMQTLLRSATITLSLSDAPPVAQLALSLRNDASEDENFAIVECEGVWLLGKPPREARPTFVTPAAWAHFRDVVFATVRLDETYAGENYRHLDMTVASLSEAGRDWPQVKFKLFVENGTPGLEFRRGGGRFEMFVDWPGTAEDRFGPFFKIAGPDALVTAMTELPVERDRRLLSALAQILPKLVRSLATQEELEGADAQSWLTYARALRAAKPGP